MKSHRAVVLLNLCVALIVANIVFVAGVDKTQPTVYHLLLLYLHTCSTIASHYLFKSSQVASN